MLQTFMLADPVLVPIIDPRRVPDDLTQLTCPRCREYLSLHIPDPELSDRMLATCEACKSWFLFDRSERRIVMLPEFDRNGIKRLVPTSAKPGGELNGLDRRTA
jgi:hypothetical protein